MTHPEPHKNGKHEADKAAAHKADVAAQTPAKKAVDLTPPKGAVTEVKAPDLTPPANGSAAPNLTPPTQKKEAAPKKEKAPKAPKEPKVPRESNFKKVYPDNAVINVLCNANPKRPGTNAHETFALYAANKTVGEFIKAGGFYAALSWDVGHGFLRVDIPAATVIATQASAAAPVVMEEKK